MKVVTMVGMKADQMAVKSVVLMVGWTVGKLVEKKGER